MRKKRAHHSKKRSEKSSNAKTQLRYSTPPDRRFMRAAISEMMLSKSEHPAKADPLVGAVLVSEGKIISRAHRGNYGLGDHSEFTILEKASAKIPSNATLFVTLEPCTKRNYPKVSCAMRVIAAGIKRVFVGILDPNPDIYGLGVQELKAAGIEVGFFDDDLAEDIERQNEIFLKEQRGRAAKLQALQLRAPEREELTPVNEAAVGDLSLEAIREYATRAKLSLRIPSVQSWKELSSRGFLKVANKPNEYIPTVGGIVLFGKNPHVFLPQCRIKADAFGNGMAEGPALERSLEQLDIVGPLASQIWQAVDFVLRHVRKFPRIVGAIREALPEYPIAVIREALVNALVHRDYKTGSHTFLRVYRNGIIIESPGLPVPPLTIDMFPSDVVSAPRNAKIAQAAFDLGLMEARGYGIRNMPDRLREYNLRDPRFSVEKGFFRVTLYGREATPSRIRFDQTILAQLNQRQLKLLDLLDERKFITSIGWATVAHITRQAARNDLEMLLRNSIVQKRGTGRATAYQLQL